MDPNEVLAKVYQLRDELSELDEVVPTERSTTVILYALPGEKYDVFKQQAIRDPELGPEKIKSMMKAIFTKLSERLSTTKKSSEPNHNSRENGRESAMFSDDVPLL